MTRSRSLLALFTVLSGCQRGTAIEVIVTVDGEAVASCVRVEASSKGEVFTTDGMIRKDALTVGIVGSKLLGNLVSLIARGSIGVGCDEPQLLNLESEVVETNFEQGKIRQVTIALHAPGPETDVDGDGYRAAALDGADCDDTRVEVRPGLPELCGDELDDDCDGLADCASPDCAGRGPAERCDGKDNDCDGMIDESFAVGYRCTAGIGVCEREGVNVCDSDGGTANCSQTPDPTQASTEVCNGLDDDCDGVIDNGFAVGVVCQMGTAACARSGVLVCSAGGGTGCSVSIDLTKATREVCDGLDNDCDGLVDQAPQCGGPAIDVAESSQQWGVSESLTDATEPCSDVARGLVSVTDEFAFPWVVAGTRAIKVSYGPDGAAYFSTHYPALRDGAWDLSTRTGLSLTVSALQPGTYGGWSPNGPTVVLCGRDGGSLQLDPVAPTLLPTDGGTIVLQVPLVSADGGWRAFLDGGFDLRTVDSFEVHLDPTRGLGVGTCTMWLDDVHFY